MDYMYGQLYKQIKEIEYKGRNSETTVVTVDQKTKTIRVDVKILSPEQLPKDEGNYVLLVEIDENGNHTLKWVSTQSTLDRIKELEDKTYKLTYNKDTDTSTFDSNVTINKDLNVEGNTIFNNKVTVLNPPVDATDATNREYVDDSIKAHFTSLNIENSTGNSSLRQKYSINDVDYGAVASGINAAAFGGKRWDKLDDTSRMMTSAEGNQSFAAGGSVHAYGDFSVAFGKDTVARQGASFAAGSSTAGMAEEEFNKFFWDSTNNVGIRGGSKNASGQICDFTGAPYEKSYAFATALGCDCEAKGPRSFAVGDNTHAIGTGSIALGSNAWSSGANSFTIGNHTNASGTCSFSGGIDSISAGNYSLTFGQQDTAPADFAVSIGYNCRADGKYSIALQKDNLAADTAEAGTVIGIGNAVSGRGAFAGGIYMNSATGKASFAFGQQCAANADYSAALGFGAIASTEGQVAVGIGTKYNEAAQFIVGNGTLDTRSNAFEVLKDGRAKVQTAPKEATDIVRLKEINDLDNVYVRRYKAETIAERRAYIVKPDGYDYTLPIHISALGDDLPIRTSTGQLKATDGVADDDLATIKQLNEGLNAKLDKVAITSGKFQAYITGYDENGSKQLMVDLASDTSGNSIARRDNNGRLQAAAGAVADDVATFGQLGYINNVLQANIDKKIDLVEGDTTIALKNNSTISYTSSTTASTIMQRDSSGRVKVEDGINNKDAVNKGQLDTKLDLTGGTLTGNLTIQDADVEITKTTEGKGNLTVGGNLKVNGTTTTVDTETLAVKDNLIVANADNTELVNLSGLAIKTGNKDADENAIAYGILYDPATSADSVKLGLGSINKTTNEFTFKSATDANPVATRDDSTKLTDNHLLVWNSVKHTLIDANNLVDSITPASLGLNNFVLDGGEIVQQNI